MVAFTPFQGMRPRVRQAPGYQNPQETEESLFSKIGTPVLSGVARVANILDLPGSSVRDVLAGENPFDQWLTPTQHKNRVTGRDVLTKWGLTRPNKETGISGWFDDPMEAVRDIGGFGAEVLTDPLTWTPAGWVSGGLKSVGKGAGRVASRVLPAAVTKTATGLANQAKLLGNRLFDPAVMGMRGAETQAAARGLHAAKLANKQAGYAEYLPMMRKLEDKGLLSPEHGQVLRDVLENTKKPQIDPITEQVVREPHTPFIDPQSGASMTIPGDVRYQPVVDPGDVPDLFKEITSRVKALNETNLSDMQALGARRKELEDIIDYASRRMGADFQDKLAQSRQLAGDRRPLGTTDPSDVGRSKVYKGFEGGTNAVNRVLSDPKWEEAIQNATSRSAAVNDIADQIARDHAHEIRPLYSTEKKVGDQVVQQTKDRYKELAETIVDYHKELQDTKGLFTNHPLVDAAEGHIAAKNQIAAMNTLYDVLATPSIRTGMKDWKAGKLGQGTTVGDILHSMDNISTSHATEEVARRMGITNIPTLDDIANASSATMAAQMKKARDEALGMVRNTTIRPDVADDLTKMYTGWKVPDEVGTLGKFWRSYSSMFKAGVLTWPARYVRDMVSGLARNWENKMFDPKSFMEAHKLIQGRTVQGLTEIPAVQKWLKRTGRELNDENATKAVQELYASTKATDVFQNTDVPVQNFGKGKIEEYLDQIPGRNPTSLKDLGKTAIGRAPETNLNPLDLRGVWKKDGTVRRNTKFGPAAAGDIIGQYSDDVNRLAPFINQLRKGVGPQEAMEKIARAQVDYRPSNYTKTDQFLKQIFPFYSFAKAQIPYVAKELANRPGGRLAQILRAQNNATGDPKEFAPEYIAETATIPLGQGEDGSRRYLGGLGLMHEDPLQFAGGDLSSVLSEIGSRSHPGIKGPLEYAFDRSLFRKDMLLDELDPTIGRILTNAGVMEPTASGRAKPFPSKLGEHALANSPLSRLLTTARTLGDDRKNWLSKAVNLGTGARITDVPAYQREGIIRDAATQQAKQIGARSYTRAYFSKEQIAQAAQSDPQAAESMMAYNQLMAMLNQSAKTRKKAEEANAKR